MIYRLAQEALNNVVKHAKARNVAVELSGTADGVDLSVIDDGRGFDALVAPAGHFGLSIMRERAESIGATLTVDSRPGAGTRVLLAWRARGRSLSSRQPGARSARRQSPRK